MFSHKSWSSAHITLVMKLTEYEAVVTVAHQNMFQNNCIKILKKEFPGYNISVVFLETYPCSFS